MKTKVRDIMTRNVHVVSPDLTLTELDRRFLQHGVSGLPVVEDSILVGLVTRSDVVRQLTIEQSRAEYVTDHDQEFTENRDPELSLESIGAIVGDRLESLTVRDIMIKSPITTSRNEDIRNVAAICAERRIHRLPVLDGGVVVGMVTTLDIMRWIADSTLAS